jgi:hypothetical protein
LPIRRLKLKFYGRSREHPTLGLDQGTARRQVDYLDLVSWPDPSGRAVLAGPASSRPAPFLCDAHNGFH